MPHTADLTVEAWGTTREECFAEAVAGMAAALVERDEAVPSRAAPFVLAAASDAELLLALLDEVIFLMDTSGAVPLSAQVEAADDGGLTGTVLLGHVAETIGAVPKAATRHGLAVRHGPDGWSCAVTLDV